MKGPILKEWCVGWPPLAINYKMPFGLNNICVRGVLYDSKKDKKGRIVLLSDIILLNAETGVLKTKNRCYLLEEPDKNFLAWISKMKIGLHEYNIGA